MLLFWVSLPSAKSCCKAWSHNPALVYIVTSHRPTMNGLLLPDCLFSTAGSFCSGDCNLDSASMGAKVLNPLPDAALGALPQAFACGANIMHSAVTPTAETLIT